MSLLKSSVGFDINEKRERVCSVLNILSRITFWLKSITHGSAQTKNNLYTSLNLKHVNMSDYNTEKYQLK